MQPDRGENGPHPEPTALDWLRSLLRLRPIPIPPAPELPEPSEALALHVPEPPPAAPRPEPAEPVAPFRLTAAHLRFPVALLLALMAQFGLEGRSGVGLSVALYIAAALLAGWAAWSGDLPLDAPAATPAGPRRREGYRPAFLALAAGFAVLTFLTASRNAFRATTVIFWAGAMIAVVIGLWEGDLRPAALWARLRQALRAVRPELRLSAGGLVLLGAFALAAWYRFAALNSVPLEMVSDQAEKLYDVIDILNGRYPIFFERNTGREPLQFYLAFATLRLLGTGVSFLTLKIGTALAGFLTLPFIYLFARELAGRRAALAALLLAGVAYWPNAISRVGLRFPLYPLFVAPALYYLARALRQRRRNDFLLCGLFVGLGLHGYSPTRVLPLVVALGVALYLLHREARGGRAQAAVGLLVAGAAALAVFLPLTRVVFDLPDQFLARTLTRMSGLESPLPDAPLTIFLNNQWNALRMFAWDNGSVWVIGIPGRPALDWVTGALFHLGAAVALGRYLRHRRWIDLFVLVMIPVLQLPSTLALAFPGENPATNRAGGAILPVFALAGLTLAALPRWAGSVWGRRTAWGAGALAAALFVIVAVTNHRLVFVEWAEICRRSAWNTNDLGQVVRGFADSVGDYETAHVVAFPHWVDTRLVGINAGDPGRDYAIQPDALDTLAGESRAQLLLLNPRDEESLARLRTLFPQGTVRLFDSPLEGKDFLIFLVPPGQDMLTPAVEVP